MGRKTMLFDSKTAIDVLSFLTKNSGTGFTSSEIVKGTKRSRMGVYIVLMMLQTWKYIKIKAIGNTSLYAADFDNPVVKQFKIMNSVIELTELVDKLKSLTKKVILYGSTARGEDEIDSDIDIAIINEKSFTATVKDEIEQLKSKRKINAGIFSQFDFESLKKNNKIYYSEIDRGIVLWEDKGE